MARRTDRAGYGVLNLTGVVTSKGALMAEETLYDRLGGVFAIAAVIDHFSDAVVKNPIVGQDSANPALRTGTPTSWADCLA